MTDDRSLPYDISDECLLLAVVAFYWDAWYPVRVNINGLDLKCPKLTRLTPDTLVITADLYDELKVSTWVRTPGTVVQVFCRPGLEHIGPKEVTCYASGTWNGSPYCRTASTTSSPPDSIDEPMILIIVLIVVIVLVCAVILFVCLALFFSKYKQHKKSVNGIEDKDEMPDPPYRVSGSNVYDDNIMMHSKYNTNHYSGIYDDTPSGYPDYRHYWRRRSNDDVVNTYSKPCNGDTEHEPYYYITKASDYSPRFQKSNYRSSQWHNNSPICTKCKSNMGRAHSDNATIDRIHRDDDIDSEIRKLRRDIYLWRKRHSMGVLNIPRPKF